MLKSITTALLMLALATAAALWWWNLPASYPPATADAASTAAAAVDRSGPTGHEESSATGEPSRQLLKEESQDPQPTPAAGEQRFVELTVRVTDPEGNPVPDLLVSVVKSPLDRIVLGRTNREGTVIGNLERGLYRPHVEAHLNEGWSSEDRPRFFRLAQTRAITLTVYPCSSDARVWVMDDQGNPVHGAVVYGWGIGSDVTDENGEALLTDMPTGKLGVARVNSAPKASNLSFANPVTSEPRRLVQGFNELRITVPRRARITIEAAPSVLDRLPWPRTVTVQLGSDRYYLSSRTVKTTAWLHPGKLELKASGPEPLRLPAKHHRWIEPGSSQDWVIEHFPGERGIHGQVVDPGGHAIDRVKVHVGFASKDRQSISTRTDSEGRFRFPDLPAERLVVSVAPDLSVPNWALPPQGSGQLVVPPDHDDAPLQFTLDPSYVLRGSIRRDDAVYRQAALDVLLRGPAGSAGSDPRIAQVQPRGSRWVKPGEYLFGNLAAGSYTVHIDGKPETATQVTLGPGLPDNTATVNFEVD